MLTGFFHPDTPLHPVLTSLFSVLTRARIETATCRQAGGSTMCEPCGPIEPRPCAPIPHARMLWPHLGGEEQGCHHASAQNDHNLQKLVTCTAGRAAGNRIHVNMPICVGGRQKGESGSTASQLGVCANAVLDIAGQGDAKRSTCAHAFLCRLPTAW